MGSSGKKLAPVAEERTTLEEKTGTSNADKRESAAPHVDSLTHDEKQSLFLKKLYKLSQTYMDETPEERLAQHDKVKAVASPFSQPTEPPTEIESVTPTKSSPLVSFASRISEMSSCVSTDMICGRMSSSSRHHRRQRKPKSSPLVKEKLDIPQTITLEPTLVSRLEDDDSLTRHINALATKSPLTPSRVAVDTTFEDDLSKDSPQGVAELTYEMEISRIIPPTEGGRGGKTKQKRRFSGFRHGHSGTPSRHQLQPHHTQMEF